MLLLCKSIIFQVSSLRSQRGKSVDPGPKRAPQTKTYENNKTPLFTKQNDPNYLPIYYLDDPEFARIRPSFAPALNPNRTGEFLLQRSTSYMHCEKALSLSRPDDFLGCSFTDVTKSERVPSESKGALFGEKLFRVGV